MNTKINTLVQAALSNIYILVKLVEYVIVLIYQSLKELSTHINNQVLSNLFKRSIQGQSNKGFENK